MPDPRASSAPSTWSAARAQVRARAQARATALGLPTTALEDWRYVALAALKQPLPATARPVSREDLAPWLSAGSCALVVVDGQWRPDLSDPLPAGLQLASKDEQPDAEAAAWLARTDERLAAEQDITACWALGAGHGCRLRASGAGGQPVHLIIITSAGEQGMELTLALERDASLQLILSHCALGPSRMSLAIELTLAAGARLAVDELQLAPAPAPAQHLSVVRARCGRDSSLRWTGVHRGCALGRTRVDATLAETGASADLGAISVLRGSGQWHDLTRITHAVGPSTSQQLYKTIADESAIGSFDGLVRIQPGADQSEARQRHQSLLLSAKARIDSRPQLDIAADDVTASHGSSIGQLNADELFYLQSRGLPLAQARALLVGGFIQDVLLRLSAPARALVLRQELARSTPL